MENENAASSETNKKEDWLGEVLYLQKIFSNIFYYREWHKVPLSCLHDKITSSFFLFQPEAARRETSNIIKIEKLCTTIKENGCHLGEDKMFFIRPVFIFFTPLDFSRPGIISIFVVKTLLKNGRNSIYLDGARTYKSWQDYLENNTLPKGYMYAPKNGTYFQTDKFHLKKSVACHLKTKAKKLLENVNTVGGIAGSAALSATLFFTLPTLALPIAASTVAVTSAYSLVNGSLKLIDIGQHDESMSVSNHRALAAYLDLVSSVGGIAAGVATVSAAKIASLEGRMLKILRSVAIFGSVAQVPPVILAVITLLCSQSHEFIRDFFRCFFNVFLDVALPILQNLIVLIFASTYIPPVFGEYLAITSFEDLIKFILKLSLKNFPLAQQSLVNEILSSIICQSGSALTQKYLGGVKLDDLFSGFQKDFIKFFNFETRKNSSTISILQTAVHINRIVGYIWHRKYKDKHVSRDRLSEYLAKVVKTFHQKYLSFGETIVYLGADAILNKIVDHPFLVDVDVPIDSNRDLCLLLSATSHEFLHLNSTKRSSIFGNELLAIFPDLQVHVFTKPLNMCTSIETKKLKTYYRRKTQEIINERVTKSNSKFSFAGELIHLRLSLEKKSWTRITFKELEMSETNGFKKVDVLAVLKTLSYS